MTPAPAVSLKRVWYRYPDGTAALVDVSFATGVGQRLAILGPNGAGKSTLTLLLNGLERPTSGEVVVSGQVLGRHNETWARRTVGLVFQDPDDQVFSPTVADDLRFGPLNLGLPPGEATARARWALGKVGLEWDAVASRPPHRLSYGQRKRVAIAGVLAMRPQILVLDEPTANLDPLVEESLLAVLDELYRDGTTLVVATHDVELAAGWADRIVLMRDGRVVAEGTAETLFRPDIVSAAGLRLPRRVGPAARAGSGA